MIAKEKLEILCGVEALENFPAANEISKVEVRYKRFYKYPCQDDSLYRFQTKKESDPVEIVSNFGGATQVILHINESQYQGLAACSRLDNFSRKTGRKIAILRAFRAYRDKQKALQH
jgi:hypothetical protein